MAISHPESILKKQVIPPATLLNTFTFIYFSHFGDFVQSNITFSGVV